MRIIAAALITVLALVSHAFALDLQEDRGGQIGRYLQTLALARSSGEMVTVGGNCLSACTLVLGVIPRNRICSIYPVRFGFHNAWMPDDDGRPRPSKLGTQALWDNYPADVREVINDHGGLHRKMWFEPGSTFGIRPCNSPVYAAVHHGPTKHRSRTTKVYARR